jgi:sulfite oxidase
MAEIKAVEGVGWDNAVIANCRWEGARLRDVLEYIYGNNIASHAKHVCFSSSSNRCQDESWFGASIPISRALSLEDDVLLAYQVWLHFSFALNLYVATCVKLDYR